MFHSPVKAAISNADELKNNIVYVIEPLFTINSPLSSTNIPFILNALFFRFHNKID
ncbi:MAG: hypothetical protein ACOXZH_00015 [Bacteroidales bacterium]